MTLKELVMKVPFETLLPHLKAYEPERLNNMYAFREAYDILLNMEPAKDFKGEIRVEWSGGEVGGEDRWINVGPMHDADWEEDLAKEIMVADDVRLSPEELAMHCLWEITYWGFSPKEREEVWQEKFGRKKLNNPYEIDLDKLKDSIWRHQTPRRLRSRGQHGERLTELVFPLKWDKRKNRSKRKREYRQDKRQVYLEKMAKRENLIRMLTTEGSSFRRRDVEFLLHVAYGTQYDYHAVTEDMNSRLDYILKSMTQYQQIDLSKYNNAVVFIQSPADNPIDDSSQATFKQRVSAWLGISNIRFGSIVRQMTQQDTCVTLLLNKCKDD